MVPAMEASGVAVARFQMSTSPTAYLSKNEVIRLVREQKMAALPITVVHGRVLTTGSYPTRDEIIRALPKQRAR